MVSGLINHQSIFAQPDQGGEGQPQQSVLNQTSDGEFPLLNLELPPRFDSPAAHGQDQENSILVADETAFEELPSPDLQDDMDFLMQAPLHEAFAEVVTGEFGPNPVVARQPPEAIEEIPPQFKPDGDHVLWIDGYWWWDEEREDFIWISGVYRDAPIGQRWIAGYWHQEPTGFRWVNGFWYSEEAQELTYLPQPPSSLEVGPAMPMPSDAHYYLPGQWNFVQERYVWQPGFYTPIVDDLVWVPGCYVWTPGGHIFRPGYWDRPFVNRGVVFAPIHFRRPIFLQPGFRYQPTFLIDTSFGLLPHLFVRPNCRMYYFGSWYGDRFLRRGFQPWALQNQFRWRANRFDPLFHFYNSPFLFHQNQPVLGWARSQHLHFANNVGFRPPVAFNVNVFNQRITNNNVLIQQQAIGSLAQQQVFLADRLDRRVQAASTTRGNQRSNWMELDNRDQERQRRDLQRSLAQQRSQQESQLSQELRNRSGTADRSSPSLDSQLRRNRATTPLPREIIETATAGSNSPQSNPRRTAELSEQIRQRQTEAAARAQTRVAARDQNQAGDLANRMARGTTGNPSQRSSDSFNRNLADRQPTDRQNPARQFQQQQRADQQTLQQQLRTQQRQAAESARQPNNPTLPGGQPNQSAFPSRSSPSPSFPRGQAQDSNLLQRQNQGLADRQRVNRQTLPGGIQQSPQGGQSTFQQQLPSQQWQANDAARQQAFQRQMQQQQRQLQQQQQQQQRQLQPQQQQQQQRQLQQQLQQQQRQAIDSARRLGTEQQRGFPTQQRMDNRPQQQLRMDNRPQQQLRMDNRPQQRMESRPQQPRMESRPQTQPRESRSQGNTERRATGGNADRGSRGSGREGNSGGGGRGRR